MTTTAETLPATDWKQAPVPLIVAGLAFLVAFGQPLSTLGRDWWTDPDAGHGLLLFPVALLLAWRKGFIKNPHPQHTLGLIIIIGSVLLRYLSGLAAELFTMRMSLVGAVAGLIIYTKGFRQLLHWWLPAALILLSVPLPSVVLGSLALPLQLKASQWGATLLEMRDIPVRLTGNVLRLPGRSLFVTEACSGLRSLTALLALGLLIGGLQLKSTWSRALLVLAAIPVAMVLNAIRIFITGFLVVFVDPALAEGALHYSEGWVIFVMAFLILGALAWTLSRLEKRFRTRTESAPA